MTFALIANATLIAFVVVAIVGLLTSAIWTSRPEVGPVLARSRAAKRAARVPVRRTYQGLNA